MWRCCGNRSLRRRKSGDLKEEDPWTLKSTSPKKSRKKAAAKDNRYSSLGLEKFSSLLSDLQARRATIALESEHKPTPMLIWFRFSDSNDCVPIVLRLNDETKQFGRLKKSPDPPPQEEENKKVNAIDLPTAVSHKGGGLSWRPKYQWPLVLVLILLCLIFARTFAIFCTTLWWHMVPSMQGEEGRKQRRRMTKKKKKINSNDIL